MRLSGPTFITLWAALATGGFFIFGTYHRWRPALISLVAALGVILYWLWTGTAIIPEKEKKVVGLGLRLPIYMSGRESAGWWAMSITMVAMLIAFFSLVFCYFFFWTVRSDFPPPPAPGPDLLWPMGAMLLLLGAWAQTVLARRWNSNDRAAAFYTGLTLAIFLAIAGAAALLGGPWTAGLDPESHVYAATVWMLVIWTALQVLIGIIMQLYCIARRAAGRMTARYDIDIHNVALYWHFTAFTVVVTVAVIAGFPLVA